MAWRPDLDCSGGEGRKIQPLAVPYTRGRVLDIGSGAARLFAHWETLDSGMDYGGRRVADHHLDGVNPLPFKDEVYDAVFSSHFLEHCTDPAAALKEWWRVVKVGGHLVLYVPCSGLYPDPGEPGANPDHKVAIDDHKLLDWMRTLPHWELLEFERRSGGEEYSLYAVFRKTADGGHCTETLHRIKDHDVLVVRYGGIGDAIWASSVIAGLVDQRHRVTVMCDPQTADVLAHDPNVHAFIVQDKGQVPDADLPVYWDAWAQRYPRVVNLTGLVESGLLVRAGSPVDRLPHDARNVLLGKANYLEHLHAAAALPLQGFEAARFHPSPDEIETATRHRDLVGQSRPVVAWALTGSAGHKFYPHIARAIVRLLWTTDAVVFLLGGPDAADLEDLVVEMVAEWYGSTDRVIQTVAGEWPLRASLTFATVADVVVGPETGVLNAVAMQPHPAKVVMLSHSSAENLTKHWVNTIALEPKGVPCYPCHRLHDDWSRCTRYPVVPGAACTAAIQPEEVAEAVRKALNPSLLRRDRFVQPSAREAVEQLWRDRFGGEPSAPLVPRTEG